MTARPELHAVTFIHDAELAYEAASRAAVGHFPENQHAQREHGR